MDSTPKSGSESPQISQNSTTDVSQRRLQKNSQNLTAQQFSKISSETASENLENGKN
jgi:hypothetical protein